MSCFEALWQHSAFHGALASVTLGVSQQVRYIPRYYAFRISARRQAQLGWETLGESTMLCGEKKADKPENRGQPYEYATRGPCGEVEVGRMGGG